MLRCAQHLARVGTQMLRCAQHDSISLLVKVHYNMRAIGKAPFFNKYVLQLEQLCLLIGPPPRRGQGRRGES